MSGFTPGPWKAGARTVIAPETDDRLGLDCRLMGGNANDNRANARLIAAAPAMDLALRLIELGLARIVYTGPTLSEFCFDGIRYCMNGDWSGLMNAIGWDRAIAKANWSDAS